MIVIGDMPVPDRKTDLSQQLAHLRWKRMQNERSIRSGIEATRSAQKNNAIVRLAENREEEKTLWMQSVIKDELQRPLVLSDEDVVKIHNEDIAVRNKLMKFAKRQLSTIDRLSTMVEGRLERDEGGREEQLSKLSKLQLVKRKVKKNLKENAEKKGIVPISPVPQKLWL